LSETCPILSLGLLDTDEAGDTEAALSRRIRAGRAIPLVDLRVVDETGRELPHDGASAGEVVVRAPWLSQGYLHDAAASATLWEGGYLHTGDIATRDATGILNITDRLKDVIKCSGEWLSSLELESLVSEHPAVAEVAVIGVPDEKWGERPRALVVLKAGYDADASALREPVHRRVDEGHLPRYARLMEIRFVTSLPRTSVGKLDKKAMRTQAVEKLLR